VYRTLALLVRVPTGRGGPIEFLPLHGPRRFRQLLILALSSFLAPALGTSGSSGSATQSLNLLLSPAGKLSVPASSTMLPGPSRFSLFQGTLAVTYRVRTTPGGTGNITLQVSSDFSPGGGPSAGTGALTYTCGSATLGAACSGSQVAALNFQTPVLAIPAGSCTGGGGTCSSEDPNSVTLNFVLADDPTYSTGSYAAQLTFTISAT
jgi:hypothetical protein